MQSVKLNLLENAFDSLDEALQKFKEGQNGKTKAYKFAILHFTHFIELFFKYYVTKSHPLLIYKNPFSKNVKKQNTIGLWEAIQFLKNEGKDFSDNLSCDLEWIKSLRNQIEHYEFSMDLNEVELTLGRLMNALLVFQNTYSHSYESMIQRIDKENQDVFLQLASNYEKKLQIALQQVEMQRKKAYEGARLKEYDLSNWQISNCIKCEHLTFITDNHSKTGFKCTYCGNTYW